MEIDKEKIIKLIRDINENVEAIKEISSLPKEKFWSSKQNIAALKYYWLYAK